MMQSPDSFDIGLYSGNVSIICQEKGVSHLSKYSVLYKHIYAFLKVSALFERHTIAADAQIVSLLLLNNSILTKIWVLLFVQQYGIVAVNVPHSINMCLHFLKASKLFKRFTITVDSIKQ
jgi:hypothetical protein